MHKPRRSRAIPIHFPTSQSGDSSKALAERALKTGKLPQGLQPVAIPRRGPPPAPSQRRFVRMNRSVETGAEASSTSSSRLPGEAAQGAGAGSSSSSSGGQRGDAGPSTSSRPGSSSGAAGSQRPTASLPTPATAAGAARTHANYPVPPAEPLFSQGPPKQPPPPAPPLPSSTQATMTRPPTSAASSSSAPGSNSFAGKGAAAAPVRHALPHLPTRPSYPPVPTNPPQRPSLNTGSSWSTSRPLAPGPKAAVMFPFPPVRRDSQPLAPSPVPVAAPAPPRPVPSVALGQSTATRTTGIAMYDAVPPAEHAIHLGGPGQSSVDLPSDPSRPWVEPRSGLTSDAEGADQRQPLVKGKEREIVGAPTEPPATATSQPSQPPRATASVATATSTQQRVPPPAGSSTTSDSRTSAPTSSVPPPSEGAPTQRTQRTQSPVPRQETAIPEISKSHNSSDDDSDVEAALAEAQRKLEELQERKRRKALRKSLGGSEQRSNVSQSPAPASSSVSSSVGATGGNADAPPTFSTSSIAPPAPTQSSPTRSAPVVVEQQPDLSPQPMPSPADVPVQDAEAVPMVVDGPQPFGTSSQVVFSDLPPGTKELLLRSFISNTLVSVTHVDFQETFALVTFSNPHDAIEVVRMLSGEEFRPGVLLSMDLASNLELVETPEEDDATMAADAPAAHPSSPPRPERQPSPPPHSAAHSPQASPNQLRPPSRLISPTAQPSAAPLSPHNSLFSSQRNSPPPRSGSHISPRRQSSATSVDEALDEPVWAAKKRRRADSPPAAASSKTQPGSDTVVDLTLDSSDDEPPRPLPPVQPSKKERKRLKYTTPEFRFQNVVKLSQDRPSGSKTRWIAASDRLYACSYHKGVIEFFEKSTRKRLPTVKFDMGEGESIEGVAFAGDRLIVGRAHKKDEGGDGPLAPQISWVLAPKLLKNKPQRVVQGTLADHNHASTGVSCITALPSTALVADTPTSTSVFATGGYDHTVKLFKFDDEGKRKMWDLPGRLHTSRIDALVYDERKRWLFSGGADGRICGFDLTTAEMSKWTLPRSSVGVFQLHVSQSHPSLLLAETSRQINQCSLYDTRLAISQQPAEFGEPARDGEGSTNKGRSKYVRGSWQGNYFASADQNGSLRIWDVRNLKTHQEVLLHARGTQNRQVMLDGDDLVDLTNEGLSVRKWRLMS